VSGTPPDAARSGGAPVSPGSGEPPAAPPAPVSPLAPVLAALSERFPGAVLETIEYRGETTCLVDPGRVVDLCRFLKSEVGLEFVFLVDLCAIHWMDREYSYEVVYLLHSFVRNQRLRLKARLGEEGRMATLTGVHPGADWHEREAYDLVGVVFEGHPDLRRILMPDDYDAFPLRKDFPMKGY